MRIAIFCHSLVSDWNHGNAHFLRGVATELMARGHDVRVFEPTGAWSARNLEQDHGTEPFVEFSRRFPGLRSERYEPETLDLERAIDGASLVIVHEWSSPELVSRLGELRSRGSSFRLLFHDTHHRMVSAPEEMARFDLRHYDGVLAFGKVIADLYAERGVAARAWTWHEAADTRVFAPFEGTEREGDLVWVGNWGDEERTEELHEFLIRPSASLGLATTVHGVRYPARARAALEDAGIDFRGWIANFKVPEAFARNRVTVHVPRRPYVRALPGIPTIRVFEALACGIPLISAPWDDAEGLFAPGRDFLVARDGREMRRLLAEVLHEPELARSLARRGRETILARHTCSHRVDELLDIHHQLTSRKESRTWASA